MPLKRVPSDLSFSKMREKHAPKADLRKANEASAAPRADAAVPKPAAADTELPERPKPQPATDSKADDEAAVLRSDTSDEGQGGCAAATLDDERQAPTTTGSAREPLGTNESDSGEAEAAHGAMPPTDPSVDETTNAPTKVKMNVRVPLPADGVSEEFDNLRRIYGERVSFKAILDKALAGYEAALLDGQISGPIPPYETTKSGVQTSRVMTQEAHAKAKAALDPLNILGPSTFGAGVLKNALSWYFLREG